MFRRLDPFACLPCWHGFVMFLVRGLCSVYLAFTLAMGTPSLASIPFLIFTPFEESSSSYPHHVEGFFFKLPLHMPTLFWGVLWSASFTRLQFFGSCPWLYRGLLPGASLRMPTLSWGVQWSACLSGLRCATLVLQLLPFLRYGGLLLGASFAHARFYLGASSGVPVYLASIVRLSFCHFLSLGVFLGYHWIDHPFIRASVCWSFLSDAFSSSLVIQSPWVLAFSRRQCIFAFVAGLFKDKVYPLSISSWCLFLLSTFDSIGSSEGSTYRSSLIAFVTGLLFKDKDFILLVP